jgi:hypothetical protein
LDRATAIDVGDIQFRTPQRRGVLLLIVLSMLTLFLMLGTAYLVVSTRSREAAKAFARMAMQSHAIRIPHASLLDEAFLRLVRGSADASPTAPLGTGLNVTFEALLADKYGSSTTGTAGTVVVDGPVLRVTGVSNATAQVPGRVMTLLGDGRESTSHRVLRVDTANGTVVLDNPARRRPFLVPRGSTPYVLNGPDFSIHQDPKGAWTHNEPWDAFDADNSFLTHLAPSDASPDHSPPPNQPAVSSSIVKRAAFVLPASNSNWEGDLQNVKGGFPLGADNDGDGVIDGFFLDVGLPTQYATNGEEIHFDVSALIVDLDSRFNVNAHGSFASNMYRTGPNHRHKNWARTTGATVVPDFDNMPLGSGYGPPEINAGWMFPRSSYPDTTYSASTPAATNVFTTDLVPGENSDYAMFSGLTLDSQIGRRPSTSRFTSGVPLAKPGTAEGRYGEAAINSITSTNTLPNLVNSGSYTIRTGAAPALARPGRPHYDDTLSTLNDRGVNPAIVGTSVNAGIPPEWWDGLQGSDWRAASGNATYPPPRGIYNSPPDLHGRMITLTSTVPSSPGSLPQLVFAKPEWGATESMDDPYELRLDRGAPRNAILTSSGTVVDNIFGVAELESLLRPYDADSPQLSLRLQSLLGSNAESARLRITTESWDTTAITGTAGHKIRMWANDAVTKEAATLNGTMPLNGLLSGEVSRGERFNLNRPLAQSDDSADARGYPKDWNTMRSGAYHQQRQAYFKDLYTLLVALGRPADSTTAQWAANIVEFRDADSRVIPFEYDAEPAKGWKVDGLVVSSTSQITNQPETARRVVWGAERPELLIQEVFAWRNTASGTAGMVINLHRPWNAIAYSTGTTSTPAETCDPALDTLTNGTDGSLQNRVDLGKKSNSRAYAVTNNLYDDLSRTSLPIWRLRLTAGGSTSYLRLDTGTAGPNEFVLTDLPADATGDHKPKLGVDSTLTLTTGTTIVTGSSPTIGAAQLSLGTAVRTANKLRMPGTDTSGTVFLERLSDPTQTLTISGTVPGTNVTGQEVWDQDPNVDAATTLVPVRYLVVDQSPVTVVETSTVIPPTTVPATTSQRKPSAPFWKLPTAGTRGDISANGTITIPSAVATGGSAWFPWLNRPFVSSAELYLVPNEDAVGMLRSYVQPAQTTDLPAISANVIPAGFFDAVHVPSRFAGIHTTASPKAFATLEDAGLYNVITPVNQLSSFREPGRVNLNTVVCDDVWDAVVAGALHTSGSAAPAVSRADAKLGTSPAEGMHALMSLSGDIKLANSGTSAPIKDSHPLLEPLQDLNPLHHIYTATRLANTTTTRSNVFGIWITLRVAVANDPDSIRLHRAFYIFDRSIPVAFEPGKTHNVWDAVLLRRIIE